LSIIGERLLKVESGHRIRRSVLPQHHLMRGMASIECRQALHQTRMRKRGIDLGDAQFPEECGCNCNEVVHRVSAVVIVVMVPVVVMAGAEERDSQQAG
jgi:hypothetical protein